MNRVPRKPGNMFCRFILAVVLGAAAWACAGPPPAPPAQARPATAPPPAVAARRNPPADHTKDRKGVRHKSGSKQAVANCGPCHGQDLKGAQGPSCYACHGQEWH